MGLVPDQFLRSLNGAALAVASLALVSACTLQAPGPARPAANPPAARAADKPYEPSNASKALRVYYAGLQSELLKRDLMRTDSGARDAPFSARMLTNNFIRIALYDEFDSSSGNLVASTTESRLRRWASPIRFGLHFGASVPKSRHATERARVASLLARLSRLTGQSMRLSNEGANFNLYIVDEDERAALGPTIRAAMPGIAPSEIAAFTKMPSSTYCQVSAMVDDASSLYRRAFAVIRSEHPDLLHLSCLHEEIAQGLGLPNDSPQARPSIFNDNQEFALLTPMDELMLRMLYDDRLRPGMSITEARPIIQQIADELVGGDS